MSQIEPPQILVPLNPSAHQLALSFAKEQRDSQKGKKVYLNTLAVYAVHSYLKWLRINSDLTQSDSWNPGLRALFDVADLVLPGIGKVECLRILPSEMGCILPLEVTDERIGYVGVKFNENLKEVHLVGFIPETEIDSLSPPERLEIEDFQPIKNLAERIWLLSSGDLLNQENPLGQSQTIVNLRQWFERTFEAAWQSVETIEGTQSASPSFGVRVPSFLRELPYDPALAVTRVKQLDLGMRLSGYSLALMVTIAPRPDGEIYIRLRLRPGAGLRRLPEGVQLTVFDESNNTSPELNAQSREADVWIQLQFTGTSGEQFKATVSLESAEVTEYFVL